MLYQFDEQKDRRATESVKWTYYDPDVLPLWVADMDFVSPEPVIRALRERVEHGIFGYGMNLPGLREAIVARMDSLYHWKITPDDLVFTAGVVSGFNRAAHALMQPGDGLLFQTPVYSPFFGVAQNVGGVSHESVLSMAPDGSYFPDWDEFEQKMADPVRMFLLCNPHNPVGRVYTRHELERMAEICLRKNVVICSDEIHCDLIYPGHKHIPIASLDPEIAQRTITLMAPSKTYNIAGLSFSFAIIQNPEIRKQYNNSDKGLAHGVNILGMTAARAAYQEGQEWLDQVMEYLDGNRQVLHQFVNQQMPGVKMALPEGTYLAWLDCRETDAGEKPANFFLEKARVALGEGSGFGTTGTGFVRLNFGCQRSVLLEALERMKRALEQSG